MEAKLTFEHLNKEVTVTVKSYSSNSEVTTFTMSNTPCVKSWAIENFIAFESNDTELLSVTIPTVHITKFEPL